MCMIYDQEGNILIQNRTKSWCGVAFPGGHVESKESIVDSVKRELLEETGLTIDNVQLCGIKQWFKDDVRSICFLFKTDTFKGELKSNDEGENKWIKREDLSRYKLASNFEIMLQVFENSNITEHYPVRNLDDSIDILR